MTIDKIVIYWPCSRFSLFLDYICVGLPARPRIGAGNRLWHRLYHGVLDETWRPLRRPIEQRFEEEN